MKNIIFILTTITCASIFSLVPSANALGLIALALGAFFYREKASTKWQKILCWMLIVPLAFFSATYKPEGFTYPFLFEMVGSDGGKAFPLYANFSKGLVGFLLVLLLWPKTTKDVFKASLRWQVSALLLSPVLVIVGAILLLGLQWQLKTIEQIMVFSLVNLLFTCVAEEAFMRFLLQQPFIVVMKKWSDNLWLQESIPLLAVTVIFVLIHQGVGGAAIYVYALAGLLYGLSYSLSKNIVYPIIIHAVVNIMHFSLLTYPI